MTWTCPQGWDSHSGPTSEKHTSGINSSVAAVTLLTLKFPWETEGTASSAAGSRRESLDVRGPRDTDSRMRALKLISHREAHVQVTGRCHPRYPPEWLESTAREESGAGRQELEPLCSAVGMNACWYHHSERQFSWMFAESEANNSTPRCVSYRSTLMFIRGVHSDTSPQPGNFPSTYPEFDG